MDLGDKGHAQDSASVGVATRVEDKGNWKCAWKVTKYDEDIDAMVEQALPFWAKGPLRGLPSVRARADELREHFQNTLEPAEVIEGEGNLLMNCGINEMLELLMGAAATAYSNANAYTGCGDSNAAAAATQTDLQAAVNKVYVAMQASYPSLAAQTITFQSSYGAGTGTWAWEEVAVFNGNTPPGDEMLNRVVSSLGTKAAGATWVLSIAITIS